MIIELGQKCLLAAIEQPLRIGKTFDLRAGPRLQDTLAHLELDARHLRVETGCYSMVDRVRTNGHFRVARDRLQVRDGQSVARVVIAGLGSQPGKQPIPRNNTRRNEQSDRYLVLADHGEQVAKFLEPVVER